MQVKEESMLRAMGWLQHEDMKEQDLMSTLGFNDIANQSAMANSVWCGQVLK